LAQHSPDPYLPDVAMTLNNLGLLHGVQGWAEDARQHFEEALKIRREWAQHNPDIYLRDVATTLNYLAPERARGDVQRIFRAPGTERLYSGVTKRTASELLIFWRKETHAAGAFSPSRSWLYRGSLAKTPDQHNHVGDGVHGVAFPSGEVGSRGE
jgi:hypothetical protein